MPWWLVLAAFVVGVGAAALMFEFAWVLQKRADNGRGTPRPTGTRRCAPPNRGYMSGPTPVAQLRPPPRGPGLGARPYDWDRDGL